MLLTFSIHVEDQREAESHWTRQSAPRVVTPSINCTSGVRKAVSQLSLDFIQSNSWFRQTPEKAQLSANQENLTVS